MAAHMYAVRQAGPPLSLTTAESADGSHHGSTSDRNEAACIVSTVLRRLGHLTKRKANSSGMSSGFSNFGSTNGSTDGGPASSTDGGGVSVSSSAHGGSTTLGTGSTHNTQHAQHGVGDR